MLESTEQIINIHNLVDLPSDSEILNISRHIILVLNFTQSLETERKAIGGDFIKRFPQHLIEVHSFKPRIEIRKLITNHEIDSNQDFFEKYALDYRELSTKLIYQLSEKYKIDLKKEIPYCAFLKHWQNHSQSGSLKEWKYFFHGFHCAFKNIKSGQYIEVPIVFGLEFGGLDPYFFSLYIKSTHEYKPLPVGIYEDYKDGLKIIERMISLGKFEKINSTFPNHFGTVVKNRPNKTEVITFENPLDQMKLKPKFSLLKFLKFKK